MVRALHLGRADAAGEHRGAMSDPIPKRSRILRDTAIGAVVGGVIGALVTFKHTGVERPGVWAPFVLWIAFFTYWGWASRNQAMTASAESERSTYTHRVLLNLSLLILIAPIPGLRTRFLPDSPVFLALGLGIQLAFIGLAIWARRHLGSNWSAEVRIAVDHQLINTGPYRWLRHPIYTAMLGMYTGTAIASGEIHALIGLAIVCIAYWRKVGIEERTLAEQFGASWQAYRQTTWGVVPFVR